MPSVSSTSSRGGKTSSRLVDGPPSHRTKKRSPGSSTTGSPLWSYLCSELRASACGSLESRRATPPCCPVAQGVATQRAIDQLSVVVLCAQSDEWSTFPRRAMCIDGRTDESGFDRRRRVGASGRVGATAHSGGLRHLHVRSPSRCRG